MTTFSDVVDAADKLSVEDQQSLVEILRRRIAKRNRDPLVRDVAEGRALPEVQRRSAASIGLAVVAVGLCVFVEAAILSSRQQFSRFFDDFGVSLTLLTRFAVGPFFLMLLAIVILVAIAKEFVPGIRFAWDVCNLVILFLGASCLAIYVVGIFAPLMSLIDSLS